MKRQVQIIQCNHQLSYVGNMVTNKTKELETKSSHLETWTTRLLLFICCVILCTTAFFHTWKKSEARKLGFIYDKSLKKKANLLEQYKLLKLKLESLQHPQRLAQIALQELNMQAPSIRTLVSKLKNTKKTKKKVQVAFTQLRGFTSH